MNRSLATYALITATLMAVGCMVPVQHGLDERQANEVVSALERSAIGAEKKKEEGNGAGFVVAVSSSDGPRALDLLRSLGLPRGERRGMAEMYGQPSLVPSATEERARFVEALGNDLERTLETIEGVASARVHIVLSEADPLSLDPKPRVAAQAAVLLKIRNGAAAPIKESDVQKLVAGGVPGLDPVRVAVVTTAAPEWTQAGGATLASIGPLRVSPGSRGLLIGALLGGLALVAGLATLLIASARRLSAAQRAD